MFKDIPVRIGGEAAGLLRQLIAQESVSGVDEAIGLALRHVGGRGLKPPASTSASEGKGKGLSLRVRGESARAVHAMVKAGAAPTPDLAVDWALRQAANEGAFSRAARRANPPEPSTGPGRGAPQLYSRLDFYRCFVIALVVGTALVLINVRPVPGEGPDGGRIVLNYMVPFIVASSSAILANHARVKAARKKSAR